ncbi:MAG: transcription antitermination factor NusB [Mariprofundaceae bacterium]
MSESYIDTTISVRARAVQVLVQVFERGRKAEVVLDRLAVQLDSRDRALLHELVFGVLRRFFSLEADISRFLKQKPDIEARMTLLIGAYQLRYMRVPSHAAVSECVNVIKPLQPKAAGMINAVLRKLADHDVPKKLKPYQRAELPKWMYSQWRDGFGMDVVQDFCKALQVPPRLCVAVFVERDVWLEQVLAMGIDAELGSFSPYAVLLPAGVRVPELPGFEAGAFTVMDQAAQIAVMALKAPEQGVLLDLCAAPGGKTALLAHRFPNMQVIAIELNAKRIPRLRENLKRLNCQNVTVLQANALALPFDTASIDAIVLDAPCSASGILRRHPDAKFLHDETALPLTASTQLGMLKESLRVLKQDACMLYVVCSIHEQENEQVLAGYNVLKKQRIYPSLQHDGFFWGIVQK